MRTSGRIIIAAEAAGGVVVKGRHLACPHLRPGGQAGVIVQVGHVVAGLIAMGVHAQQAGHVGKFLGHLVLGVKTRIELGRESRIAAHGLDQSGDILRHKEAVMPGIGFRVILEVDCVGIERREPGSVLQLTAHEAG